MARRPLVSNPVKRVATVTGKPMRKPSDQEMHERRLFVRQLHASGMHASEIVEQATQPQRQRDEHGKEYIAPPRFDCEPSAILRLITEIRAELKRELEVFAPTNQAAALQRLYGDLVRLRSELQQMRGQPKKDWVSIRGHSAEVRHLEKLVAEIEGTLNPVRVEHNVSGQVGLNMTRAIGGMTKEQIDEAVREEREKLLDVGSITTHAELPEPETKAHQAIDAHADVRRGQPVQAASPPGVLDHPAKAPGVRRERSSDIAARREIRSPLDALLDDGAQARRSISRPVSR